MGARGVHVPRVLRARPRARLEPGTTTGALPGTAGAHRLLPSGRRRAHQEPAAHGCACQQRRRTPHETSRSGEALFACDAGSMSRPDRARPAPEERIGHPRPRGPGAGRTPRAKPLEPGGRPPVRQARRPAEPRREPGDARATPGGRRAGRGRGHAAEPGGRHAPTGAAPPRRVEQQTAVRGLDRGDRARGDRPAAAQSARPDDQRVRATGGRGEDDLLDPRTERLDDQSFGMREPVVEHAAAAREDGRR